MVCSASLRAWSTRFVVRSRCSARWPRATPACNLSGASISVFGINLSDIIIDDNDIFGDGVNIAARLEALAEPGGICVSRMVRDQVRDKLAIAFEDMGEQQVKNIARPVRAYRAVLAERAERPSILSDT